MINIGKWFHQLFKPHCHVCITENVCKNCEYLKEVIASEKREKKELLEMILRKPEIDRPEIKVGTQVPASRHSWYNVKHELEMAARQKVLLENDQYNESIKNENKSTEELEKELELQ